MLQAARHLLQAKVSGQHIHQAWARRARFRAYGCPDLSSQYRRTDRRDQLNLTDFQTFAYDTARYLHLLSIKDGIQPLCHTPAGAAGSGHRA